MPSWDASDCAKVIPPAALMAFNAVVPSWSMPETITATVRPPFVSASEHRKVLIVFGQPKAGAFSAEEQIVPQGYIRSRRHDKYMVRARF